MVRLQRDFVWLRTSRAATWHNEFVHAHPVAANDSPVLYSVQTRAMLGRLRLHACGRVWSLQVCRFCPQAISTAASSGGR